MKILIICTGNSCRSQMAHGFLQSFDSRLQVFSAGTKPAEKVHPLAVQVMQERNIDISRHVPTHIDTYIDDSWDYVITVCGGAKETCPVFHGKVKHLLHMGFDDPAAVEGAPQKIAYEFRRIRDDIERLFRQWYQDELATQLEGKFLIPN